MSANAKNQAMEYRKLGKTELLVSLIGYGASPLGDVYGAIDSREAEMAAHLAIDRGVNFFDVSPYYGLNLAEERLGQYLLGRREKVILATKCGRYGLSDFDFSAKRVVTSLEESLRRLKTDYLDLFQAHDVEFGDVSQVIHETIPAMRKLQEQGKVRYIGITGYPPKLLARIAGQAPVDTILSYCHYNLLVTDMDEVLTPFAESQEIGLINASALHMGVLTERGGPDWHPAPPVVHEASRNAVEFCRKRGLNLSKIALRFCLDHPYVSSTLIGMPTRANVQANLALLREKTDPELIREILAVMAPGLNCVWPSGRTAE